MFSKKVSRILKEKICDKLWVLSLTTFTAALPCWWFCGIIPMVPIVTAGMMAVCYNAQSCLVFHPNLPKGARKTVPLPSELMLPCENIRLCTEDGFFIHLYFIKSPFKCKDRPTIVYFHGNAGNIGLGLHHAEAMYCNLNANILMVEYRGYGLSEGTPSEKGFYSDAQVILKYLLQRGDIDSSKIIIYGISMGGAVAIDLASRPNFRQKIWALIVENTFTSIPDMAPVVMKIQCLKIIPKQIHKNKFESLSKIGHVVCPTLIMCGDQDAFVPNTMSETLFKRCGAIHKRLVSIEGGGHDNTYTCQNYCSELAKFIEEIPPLSKL